VLVDETFGGSPGAVTFWHGSEKCFKDDDDGVVYAAIELVVGLVFVR